MVKNLLNFVPGEFLKLNRSKILIIALLGALITPAMMLVDAVKIHFSGSNCII